MSSVRDIPVSGIALALASCTALALGGLSIWLCGAVLLVWLGSLWLTGGNPPPAAAPAQANPLDRETMRDMLELSGTPLLLTEDGKISVANNEARKLLGSHIIGQDARVAFRNPAAIELINSNSGGTTLVRGLVRRRDIWRMGRQTIDSRMAVIELIDRTAEADIGRAHTDFVANASHELRTPLASIIGYVETLRDDGDRIDAEKREHFLDTILSEARRMQDLVSDLMSLSRVEAEKHDLPQDHIELKEVVERAAHDGATAERQDRLELNLEGEFTIAGDRQQIEQLVRNLVDNAFKYGAQDKPVTVTLEHGRAGHVRLAVKDFGDGISEEHLPHLTRRFYRTDPGRSRASGGTGLGLAIVKHIVERHRGRLDIESSIGNGTLVSVRFPLIQESDDAEPA
ncbi:sensor histidine kinase [Qipengyuania atrilutea]|uniref:histidine kinase n=1 Tax=Qipengyuania atrilutea TaxID=2744473 RepID=A0A850GZ90_9SPHN|nr:ATP-binding protein [Actirhodobacter atriluteus]NVD43707.1 two-component sensor histidine kinase [Actirhodobacter atriluteus]